LWNFQSGGQLEAGCYFKVGPCFHICNIVNILLLRPTGSQKKRGYFSSESIDVMLEFFFGYNAEEFFNYVFCTPFS